MKPAPQDDHVGSIVSEYSHQRQRGCRYALVQRKPLVRFIEPMGKHSIAGHQPVGETEHLNFFSCTAAGAQRAQVVKLPAFGRHAIEQGVFQRAEVSFP